MSMFCYELWCLDGSIKNCVVCGINNSLRNFFEFNVRFFDYGF